MTDSGGIYLADLGGERREPVMVLSNQSFTTRSGRVLVAPGWSGPAPAVMPPWRIPVDDRTFAVDRTLSVKEEHLLDRIGEARYGALTAARRALLAIT